MNQYSSPFSLQCKITSMKNQQFIREKNYLQFLPLYALWAYSMCIQYCPLSFQCMRYEGTQEFLEPYYTTVSVKHLTDAWYMLDRCFALLDRCLMGCLTIDLTLSTKQIASAWRKWLYICICMIWVWSQQLNHAFNEIRAKLSRSKFN